MPNSPKINGTPMIGPMKTLEKLAQHYEQKAAAIRATMAILGEHSGASAARRGSSTIDAAIALDAQRRAPAGHGSISAVRQRRERTAALLATFDPTTPNPVLLRGGGRLVTLGYLRKKGNGYVRTAKVFTP